MRINELRKDWVIQLEAYDKAIALIEEEKRRGVNNDNLGKPTRLWVEMLEKWRSEIQQLLIDYPGDI